MTTLLFARSRLSRRTAATVAAAFVVEAMLQGRSFILPVMPWEVVVYTSPLLPAIPAVVALRAVEPGFSPLEGLTGYPARLRLCRFLWLVAVAIALAATQAAVSVASPHPEDTYPISSATEVRNVVAFFAVGVVSAAVVGAELTWLAPLVLMTALMFFGRDRDQAVHSWALLLRQGGDAASWLAVAAVIAGAVGLFTWRDLAPLVRVEQQGSAGW